MPTSQLHPSPEAAQYLVLKQAQADKLGLRAHGQIGYQILCDESRQDIFFRIVANAGSGAFSDEAIPLQSLMRCVADRDQQLPIRASLLQPAIVGKSSCNAGFIAASLVAEGLLARDDSKRHVLIDTNTWDAWRQATLSLHPQGDPVRVDKSAKAVTFDTTSTEIASTTSAPDAPPEARQQDGARRRIKGTIKRKE